MKGADAEDAHSQIIRISPSLSHTGGFSRRRGSVSGLSLPPAPAASVATDDDIQSVPSSTQSMPGMPLIDHPSLAIDIELIDSQPKRGNSPVSPVEKMTFCASAYPDMRSQSSDDSVKDILRTLSAPMASRSTPRTWRLNQATTRKEFSEALATLSVQVREDIRNGSSVHNSLVLDRTPSTSSKTAKRSGSILDQLKKLEELKDLVATREEEILACVSMGEKLIEQLKEREEEISFLTEQNVRLQEENDELADTLQEEARETMRSSNVDKVTAARAVEELVAAEARLKKKEENLQREKDDMQWCKRETLRGAAEATAMALQIGELEDTVSEMQLDQLTMEEDAARSAVSNAHVSGCLELLQQMERGVMPIVTELLKGDAARKAEADAEAVNGLRLRNEELKTTITKLQESVSSKSSELGAAAQELHSRSLELQEKAGMVQSLEEDVARVEAEVRGLKDALQRSLKEKEEHVARQNATEKSLHSDLGARTLEVKELMTELSKAREKLQNTEVEWKGKTSSLKMEVEAKDVQIKHLSQKLSIQEEEARILAEEKVDLTARLQSKAASCAQQDTLHVEIHQLKVELNNQKNNEAALRKVMRGKEAEITALGEQKDKMRGEHRADVASLEVLREEVGTTQAALRTKGERCERLKTELEALCGRLQESSVRLADLEGEVNSGLVEMADMQDENKKLKEEKIVLREEKVVLQGEVQRLEVLERSGKRNPVVEQIVDRVQALRVLGEKREEYGVKLAAYQASVESLVRLNEGCGVEPRGSSPSARMHRRFQELQSQLSRLDNEVRETRTTHQSTAVEMQRTSDLLKDSISQSRTMLAGARSPQYTTPLLSHKPF